MAGGEESLEKGNAAGRTENVDGRKEEKRRRRRRKKKRNNQRLHKAKKRKKKRTTRYDSDGARPIRSAAKVNRCEVKTQ